MYLCSVTGNLFKVFFFLNVFPCWFLFAVTAKNIIKYEHKSMDFSAFSCFISTVKYKIVKKKCSELVLWSSIKTEGIKWNCQKNRTNVLIKLKIKNARIWIQWIAGYQSHLLCFWCLPPLSDSQTTKWVRSMR